MTTAKRVVLRGEHFVTERVESVWPGPECLVGQAPPERFPSYHIVEVSSVEPGSLGVSVAWRRPHPYKARRWEWTAGFVRGEHVPARVGIALGGVRVRARMERFVAWMNANACPRSALVLAGFHRSPESFFASLVHGHYYELGWVFRRLDAFDAIIPWYASFCMTGAAEMPALVAEAIGSTWASLPWQDDPADGGGR